MAPCNIFSCAKLMTTPLPQGGWGSKNKEGQKDKNAEHTLSWEIFFRDRNSAKDFYGLWQQGN